ncbi:MAG: nuclear transport factor 2 family protein [Actinomycetota bacterium]|nr:nuclear transport factor 2 family protein [Actinomycetota bacterium]
MEIWEVIARECIRDLVTTYNSNGDAGRFVPLMEVFADDSVMELPDRTYTGKAEISEIFTGARAKLTGATPSYVRHFGATHKIELIDPDNATGRMYFAVVTRIGLDHWGRYVDRYKLVDGTWRIHHRKVIIDGTSDGSVMVG